MSNWGTGSSARVGTARHKKQRARILRRDGYQCQLHYAGCLGTATEMDHIVNVAAGGTDEDDNVHAVCSKCHQAKTNREAVAGAAAKRARLKLPTSRHPGLL
ncbi:HNH endonuclease [Nocardia nova]|uniref:HNH endonuclease n=1 Tax=Nocardia nova TaxID=37330 RepID=UPI0037A68094